MWYWLTKQSFTDDSYLENIENTVSSDFYKISTCVPTISKYSMIFLLETDIKKEKVPKEPKQQRNDFLSSFCIYGIFTDVLVILKEIIYDHSCNQNHTSNPTNLNRNIYTYTGKIPNLRIFPHLIDPVYHVAKLRCFISFCLIRYTTHNINKQYLSIWFCLERKKSTKVLKKKRRR